MPYIDQLPRLPAMTYRPEEDIPVKHPRRTNRYIQGIESAIRRINILTKYLALGKYGSLNACIELGFSIKHHLQMFKNTTMSIKNPSNIVKGNINYIKEIRQQLKCPNTTQKIARKRG